MNLKWTLNRLRAMGVREVGHRGRQFMHGRLERAGFLHARPVRASAERGKAWVRDLPRQFRAETYRQAAERILEGRFVLFEREYALGWPPQWNRDPETGIRAPLSSARHSTIAMRVWSETSNICGSQTATSSS